MLNNTRWKWQPRSECRRHELSLEAFVVRMLRSKAGIMSVVLCLSLLIPKISCLVPSDTVSSETHCLNSTI